MVALLGENPQQDEWAGRIRCALKLVKLAAGAFDSADVLGTDERSLPSWTIAEPHENSCKAGAAPVLAGAVDPATNNPDSSRSVRRKRLHMMTDCFDTKRNFTHAEVMIMTTA